MIRIASQLTFCSPNQILPRRMVEQDEHNLITGILDLDALQTEPANTLFYDGILSAGFVSVKQNSLTVSDALQLEKYNYISVSDQFPVNDLHPGTKPFILDFATDSVSVINHLLREFSPALQEFSIFEVIAACTYFPALVLNKPVLLTENIQTELILWEGVDLINKKITQHTRIRSIREF